MSESLLPWTPGDEFDLAMKRIERNDPRSPAVTVWRRLLWWHLAEKQRDVWAVPDGVLEDVAEWGSDGRVYE